MLHRGPGHRAGIAVVAILIALSAAAESLPGDRERALRDAEVERFLAEGKIVGYEPIGTPPVDFEDASRLCQERSQFRNGSGATQVDWNAYERCMRTLGWVRGQG